MAGKKTQRETDCFWHIQTVAKILELQEYCGDIVNFKSYSKSYKNKKRLPNDPENLMVFKDVHTPIVTRITWELVQQKRATESRKRPSALHEENIFSSILVCADCGSNMHRHFNQKNHDIKYFNCYNYVGNRGTCPTTHYVRLDFLQQVVLGEIRRLTRFASQYEDEFAQTIMGECMKNLALQSEQNRRELKSILARDAEIDTLFERIYEDNVTGKISDDRFKRMSTSYEQEQMALRQKAEALKKDVDANDGKSVTADIFLTAVRKYTRLRKLTPRVLNELVERIEVHQSEKVNGVHVQKLTIHYNCIGSFEIPESICLPIPSVAMQTRKGVQVQYGGAQCTG